jgi:hypothetical protein
MIESKIVIFKGKNVEFQAGKSCSGSISDSLKTALETKVMRAKKFAAWLIEKQIQSTSKNPTSGLSNAILVRMPNGLFFECKTKWPTIRKPDESSGFRNKMAAIAIQKPDTNCVRKVTISHNGPVFGC